jgi:hypothetical protein
VLLNQNELEQVHKGETTSDYKSSRGSSGTITTYPDGKQRINWKALGDTGSDIGTYKILNGEKCNQWNNLPPDASKCWKFYKIGENKYSTSAPDGESVIMTFK